VRLFIILSLFLFTVFGGRPTQKAEIYLEKGRQLIAFQVTGEKGKVQFSHFDAGSYRLLVVFPQQEGKYIETKPKHQTMSKASYNPRKKTYYYQGNEGYFAVHFSGISNIKSENFNTVFKEEKDEDGNYNVIAEFGAHRKNAGMDIQVEALTAAQFKKATEKATDISTLSIRNIR